MHKLVLKQELAIAPTVRGRGVTHGSRVCQIMGVAGQRRVLVEAEGVMGKVSSACDCSVEVPRFHTHSPLGCEVSQHIQQIPRALRRLLPSSARPAGIQSGEISASCTPVVLHTSGSDQKTKTTARNKHTQKKTATFRPRTYFLNRGQTSVSLGATFNTVVNHTNNGEKRQQDSRDFVP